MLHKYKDFSSVPYTMQKSGTISTGNHSAEKVGTGRWVQSSCKLANIAGAPAQWETLSQYKVESILRNDT